MCVVGSSHFCAYPHTINFRVYFSKIKLNWGFCFMGFLSLLSLVSHLIGSTF